MTGRCAAHAGIALAVMLALGGPACGRYGPPVRRPPGADDSASDIAKDEAPGTPGVPDTSDDPGDPNERNDGEEQERDPEPAR